MSRKQLDRKMAFIIYMRNTMKAENSVPLVPNFLSVCIRWWNIQSHAWDHTNGSCIIHLKWIYVYCCADKRTYRIYICVSFISCCNFPCLSKGCETILLWTEETDLYCILCCEDMHVYTSLHILYKWNELITHLRPNAVVVPVYPYVQTSVCYGQSMTITKVLWQNTKIVQIK